MFRKLLPTLPQKFRFIKLLNKVNSSSFKSVISIEKLYPNSTLNVSTPAKIPEAQDDSFSGYIPIEKLKITYSRSSGPGGQNVNTVNTKVDIRFNVENADWLTKTVKDNIQQKYKQRINKEGFLIVKSDKTRSQLFNQADAITNLREMIRTAANLHKQTPLSEETLHTLRKRREKANQERLKEKKIRSSIKSQRKEIII